ncbi:MAG: hypothetical protein M3Q69_08810 [Acidobacteriota bacterium]|nr:hypothetical protein [Acidobacteriota bacterium]
MTRPTQDRTSLADEIWTEYRSLQLTRAARAAAHRRASELAEEATREGVYERAREAAGSIEWSMSWQDLRNEE